MGAPSPELCNLWLARAFNAHDVDAAAAMYHPEASIVEVDDVHGGTSIVRGADGIRTTMAAYIDLDPHMDVVTHHTTVAGDFAMTRSQWLIKRRADGIPTRSSTMFCRSSRAENRCDPLDSGVVVRTHAGTRSL